VGDAGFDGEALLYEVGGEVVAVMDAVVDGTGGAEIEGAAEGVALGGGDGVGEGMGEGGEVCGGEVDGGAGVEVKVEADDLRLKGSEGKFQTVFGDGLGLRVAVEAVVDLGVAFGEESDLAVGLGDGPDGVGGRDLGEKGLVGGQGGGDDAVLGACGLEGGQDGMMPGGLLEVAIDVGVQEADVALGFKAHLLHKDVAFVALVEGFDGLLEGDGDEEADADGGDVEEEVAPGVGGCVGWVDV
jgi:hypothetical protein